MLFFLKKELFMGEKSAKMHVIVQKMQTNAYATPMRLEMRLSTFAERKTAGGSNRH